MDSNLKPNITDRVASVTRGIVGAAPIVGPLVAEVVTELIPNQRIDRLTEFVQILNAKVEELEQEKLSAEFQDEEFIDLLEDGFHCATRAISRESKEYIASVIANSLTDEQIRHTQSKVLLSLLCELSDPEVILLQYHAKLVSPDLDEYREKHKDVIEGPMVHQGSNRKELDQDALYKTYRAHLERLGLIRPRFSRPRRGELPEFDDKTGKMKASWYDVTWLGRLLLRAIGLNDGMEGSNIDRTN